MQPDVFRFEKSFEHSPKPSKPPSYIDLDDFIQNAKEKEIMEFFKATSHVAKILKVSSENPFRLIMF